MKLKYELEKNVNLVKFENGRIEISFNDSLDKDFVKDLSTKLLEWTSQRWIISFSKNRGEMSIKDKAKNKQKELVENAKKSDLYKTMLDYFPDADLIGVKFLKKDDE
jgi:DNA polymerase-3 subunit gamma/tau